MAVSNIGGEAISRRLLDLATSRHNDTVALQSLSFSCTRLCNCTIFLFMLSRFSYSACLCVFLSPSCLLSAFLSVSVCLRLALAYMIISIIKSLTNFSQSRKYDAQCSIRPELPNKKRPAICPVDARTRSAMVSSCDKQTKHRKFQGLHFLYSILYNLLY